MSKVNWNNLDKRERREYMQIQMSPSYGGRSAYLPDDCSQCNSCGEPTLGTGLCIDCMKRYNHLYDKLKRLPK